MKRKWTLVSVFAAMAAATWAQPPSGAPLDRGSREAEIPAEQRTRDARRGRATPEPDAEVRRAQRPAPVDPELERPVVQREDPASQTPAASPDISGRRARPALGEPGAIDLPEASTPSTRPSPGANRRTTPGTTPASAGSSNAGSAERVRELQQRVRSANEAATPSATQQPSTMNTPPAMSRPIVEPGNTPVPVTDTPPASPSPNIPLPESAQERMRDARERLRENPAPDTEAEIERPTPGTRGRTTPATSPATDASQTPAASPTPAGTADTPASRVRTGQQVPTPATAPSTDDILPAPRTTPAPPAADATPFVPADMPDRLRRNQDNATPAAGTTPASTEPTPASDTTTSRQADPGDTTPDVTPAATTTPAADASPTPRTSPTPAASPRARVSPTPTTSPTPAGRRASDATTSTDAADRRPGQRRGQGRQRPAVSAEDATSETMNQATQELFGKGTTDERRRDRRERRDPATVELTPWIKPTVTDDQTVETSAEANTVVILPAGATPTPTPAPERITVSDPSTIINNIQNITIAPTPPPAPTPGPTPVPTPPGVTPVPRDFRPERGWVPYPGWRPPNNWRPPTGYVPPGGWSPPPGWEPPREWVPRLRGWGWNYIARRGWVVPVQWTPPPDFVVPPNWYYLPPAAYDDYGFYDPSEVVVLPGRARQDLVVNINVNEVYTPPAPPPAILVEAPPPPPRPAPLAPIQMPPQITQVQNVVEVLSRPREPNAPRYEGPVLVTSSVHFEYDSYAIQPDSFPTLDAIGTALTEEMPDAIINIEGHTDADGSDEYNQNLSEQRAWSVKSYLVQRFGIDPNRLITVGYGERAPIADNNTDAGKAMNRRAEFENVTDLYSAQVVDIETASPAPGAVEY